MVKKIYLLRHFLTISNKDDIYIGQKDINIIDKCDVTSRIPVLLNGSYCIYSSPLQRCKNTIRTFIDQYNIIVTEDNLKYDNRLKERYLGAFEGQSKEILRDKYPDIYHKKMLKYNFTPPNGEDFDEFFSRVYDFYQEKISNDNLDYIVICTHSHVLRALYCIHNKLSIEKNWYNFSFSHGEIYNLDEVNIIDG